MGVGLFDQQAASYDAQWTKWAPVRDSLHFLLEAVFARLPADARVLCVGVGTGAELLHLARRFPGWRFTAVDPSHGMLDVCRRKIEAEGIASRCHLHAGYLDSLEAADLHDAATAFLVSQLYLATEARSAFFGAIAARLRPGALLASSDLASGGGPDAYEGLLRVWLSLMASSGIPPEGLERMRAAYANDVAILAPARVASLIEAGGFEAPLQFFQAGLIHAWFSRRA